MATLFDTTVTAGNNSITSQGNTTSWSGFIDDTGGLLTGATTIGSADDTNISTINSNWTGGLTLAYERTVSGNSFTYFGGKAGGGGDQRLSDSSWDNIDIGSFNRTRTAASFVGASSWGSKWYWSGALLNNNTTFINVDDGVVGDSIPDTPDWGTTANETPLNTYATSDLVTISGMDTGATTTAFLTVAITGDGGGTVDAQYKFNSSPWITINTSTGSPLSNISNDDEIQLRSKYSAINTTVKIKFASTGVPDTFFTMNTVDALAPVIDAVNVSNIEAANETVTVSLSDDGEGGTGLYYAQSDTNSLPAAGNWQTSNQFSHPRGTTKYYWANRYDAGSVSLVRGGSASFEKFVDYLNPKAFTFTVDGDSGVVNFPYSKTSFVCTIAGADTDHTYQLLYGTNSPTTDAGSRTTNGDITVSGGEMVPAGGQMQYRMRVARGTTSGGDGNYIWFGAGPFVRYRYPQTPTISYGDNSDTVESPTCTATITMSNTDGVSTYWFRRIADGTAFGSYIEDANNVVSYADQTRAANQAYDYQGRIIGSNGLEAVSTVINAQQLIKRYLDPKAFTIGNNDTEDYVYGTSSFIVSITNEDTDHSYRVLYGTGTPGTSGGQTTGDNITLSGAEFPAAGTDMNYQVQVNRGTTSGGSGAWNDSGPEFTKGQFPQTPTGISITDNGTESNTTASFKIDVNGTTGANSSTVSLNANYTTGAVASGSNLNIDRDGTAVYCRNTGENGLLADASFTTTATYLDPVTTGYSFDVIPGDQAFSSGVPVFSFTAAQANHTVIIFQGTTARSAAQTGLTDYNNIATTAGVPAGGSTTYNLKTFRNTTAGGNPANTYVPTDAGTATVKKYPETPTISYGDNSDTVESPTCTATITMSNTSGASTYWFRRIADGTAFGSYIEDANNVVSYADQTRAANQAYDYQGRIVGSNGLEAVSTVINAQQLIKRYLDPKAVTLTNADTENISAGTSSFVVTFSNTDADHTYKINVGGSNAGEEPYTGSNIDYTLDGYFSPAKGVSLTYQPQVKRGTTSGGGNSYVDVGAAFTKSRFPSPASSIATFVDLGTEDATGTFTITLNGREGGASTTVTLNSNYTSTTQTYGASGVDLPDVVRAGDTIYVRVTGSNSLTADASFPTPETYLDPISVTSANVLPNSTQTTHTIGTGSAVSYLNYRVLSGGTVRGGPVVKGNNITVTDVSVPGSNLTHTIQGQRPENKGGSNNWVNTDTYLSKRAPGAPTTIVLGADPGTESNQAVFSVTVSGSLDTDATHEFSLDGGTNYQLSGTNATLTRVADAILTKATGENGRVNTANFLNFTVPHLEPKAYTITNNSNDDISYSTTVINLFHGSQDTDHEYRVLYGTTSPVTVASPTLTYSSTGAAIALNSSQSELPSAGNNLNYATQVKRGLTSGGNNVWTETSTFTLRRFPETPTITVEDDDAESASVGITVTAGASTGAGSYQGRADVDGDGAGGYTAWANLDGNRKATYTQNRNVSTADYQVKAIGSVNSLESVATLSNYDPGFLAADQSVGFDSDALVVNQDDTQATVTVNSVARATETVAVRVENGSTDLATRSGNGAITFNHGLSAGEIDTYEIFTLRDTTTGGDGVTYYATDDTFTVARLDTEADAITFGSNITGVALASVHYATEQVTGITTSVTVSVAGGSSIPFSVSSSATPSTTAGDYNTSDKSISNNEYIHLRAVASTNYSTQKFAAVSVGDPSVSTTWRVTTKATANSFDLGDAPAPREINTTYSSNTITVAGLDAGTSSNASVSAGQLSKNGGAFSQTIVSVENDDTLQVRGTSGSSYDGSSVNVVLLVENTTDTFTITTETQPTVPSGISIPNDTTTTSNTVDITCTASGGTGGTLRISEDNSTYDADEVADFTFTRGTPKTLYAKRFGTFVDSPLFTRAAFTLGYIPPATGITATPTTPTASSADMTVAISNGDATTIYYVYNSAKTTLLGFRTGNGNITFSDVGLVDGTTGTYAVQAKRPEGSGGDDALTDTTVTFQIAYDSNTANTPPSVSVSADSTTPAISTQVTLTATASDTDGTISSISWTQVGGPTTTPSPTSNTNSNTLSSTITTPSSPTTLRYKATATDNDGDSADSAILVIEVGGGAGYGFEVSNSSENKTLIVSSSVPRLVTAGNTPTISLGTVPSTTNTDVTVTGMTNDGTWEVLIYTPYFNFNVSHEVSILSGKFRIITTAESNAGVNQSLTMYYYVLRI